MNNKEKIKIAHEAYQRTRREMMTTWGEQPVQIDEALTTVKGDRVRLHNWNGLVATYNVAYKNFVRTSPQFREVWRAIHLNLRPQQRRVRR